MVKAAHRPYVPNARTNVLKLKAEFIPGLGDTVTLRAPCLPYIAPVSPLYLPCISPASPLYLHCISTVSLHLPCTSPASPPQVTLRLYGAC